MKLTNQQTVLKRVGSYLADQNDCKTLKMILLSQKLGLETPSIVYSRSAANAHVKYNADHAVVSAFLIPEMLPAFCDYFGLDPQSAKKVDRDGKFFTYQILQSTRGANGTKLTRRRHADSSPGAELFAIWQRSTNPETFKFVKLDGEFHYEIQTVNVNTEMERIVKTLSGCLWKILIDEVQEQKQRLIDELRATTDEKINIHAAFWRDLTRDLVKQVEMKAQRNPDINPTNDVKVAPMSKSKSTKKTKFHSKIPRYTGKY